MKAAVPAVVSMIVSRMSEGLPAAQRAQIIVDLAGASVEYLNDRGSILRFDLQNYTRLPHVGRRIAADGVTTDQDGAHLNVILFIDDNDRLYELEIVRFDDKDVIGPNLETLRVC